MTLEAFKRIYWWEYAHRLLGRLIGVAFLVPLSWFAVRRRIPQGYGWKLVGIFALGGLQGALGWYMVKSGSGRRPARLAIPPDRASHARVPDLRRDALVGAFAACFRGGRNS